jgi:hypothetical protein
MGGKQLNISNKLLKDWIFVDKRPTRCSMRWTMALPIFVGGSLLSKRETTW